MSDNQNANEKPITITDSLFAIATIAFFVALLTIPLGWYSIGFFNYLWKAYPYLFIAWAGMMLFNPRVWARND